MRKDAIRSAAVYRKDRPHNNGEDILICTEPSGHVAIVL